MNIVLYFRGADTIVKIMFPMSLSKLRLVATPSPIFMINTDYKNQAKVVFVGRFITTSIPKHFYLITNSHFHQFSAIPL